VITTVTGNGTGDNTAATNATSVAVDSASNIYIADSGRIRKVSNGVISTLYSPAAGQPRGPYCTVTVSDLIGGTMRVTEVQRFDDKGQPVK
jgi:hypothetical protein